MGIVRRARILGRTLSLLVQENAMDLVSAVLIPGTAKIAVKTLGVRPTRWATANRWAATTVDGGIVGGLTPPQAGAKYAVPKGLPKPGERALAVENTPHLADGFSGEIPAGYGKGIKTLLADERVPIKIGTKLLIGRMNYHYHDAEKAGPHYDLVVEGVPPGTKKFELHIPRGDYKGRYAFVTTKKGLLIIPMTDEGVVLAKPDYTLKPVEFLDQVATDAGAWVIEQKLDGSLVHAHIQGARAAFRSHRETGQTYYDRMPQVEDLSNHSRVFLLRRWMPAPRLTDTLLKGEMVHPDGHGRMGGILNALPEKAQEIQCLRGPAEFYGWDIVRYKGRDVSDLPYVQRRALLERVITDVRVYNRHWHVVQAMKPGDDPRAFYQSIIDQPLPFGEGVVVKRAMDPAGSVWYKVKQTDLADFEVISIHPSMPGTKYAQSCARMVVRDPVTGHVSEVGAFAIPDSERQWIWDHRADLTGAVAKVQIQEKTVVGAARAGVFRGWHADPRFGGAGAEYSLAMYADALAGGNPELATETMYRLKSAAGWRR